MELHSAVHLERQRAVKTALPRAAPRVLHLVYNSAENSVEQRAAKKDPLMGTKSDVYWVATKVEQSAELMVLW